VQGQDAQQAPESETQQRRLKGLDRKPTAPMGVPILTGLAAGAVHVVGGADYLVAMAPFSLKRPLDACHSALAWGAGHSAGVIVLDLIATGIKGLAHGEAMSSWAELLAGVDLLVVGALAKRTSFGLELHSHSHSHSNSDSSTSEHMRKMIN